MTQVLNQEYCVNMDNQILGPDLFEKEATKILMQQKQSTRTEIYTKTQKLKKNDYFSILYKDKTLL